MNCGIRNAISPLSSMAMAAGKPKHIPHESAVYTRENAGSAQVGWIHFQPLWQEICRTDPELFE